MNTEFADFQNQEHDILELARIAMETTNVDVQKALAEAGSAIVCNSLLSNPNLNKDVRRRVQKVTGWK